ncbi:MAG: hypothetical protein AAF630_00465 [Cyanobacteria bacterium P01_C01_bin.38]
MLLIWILATGIAGAIIGYMAAPGDFFWELIASGFVVGIAQCIVLRNYIKSSIWWIPASGFGWIVGVYAVIFARQILDFAIEKGASLQVEIYFL